MKLFSTGGRIVAPPRPCRMTNMKRLLLCVIATAIAATATADEAPLRLDANACAALKGLAVPASAFGLPTSGAVVETAVATDFCKITGIVKPVSAKAQNLEFEVNLPFQWNRRALQMGGGGYDGSLVTGLTPYTLQPPNTDTPLKQGYVTLGSDGGHKGKPGFDGTFGLDDETWDAGKASGESRRRSCKIGRAHV